MVDRTWVLIDVDTAYFIAKYLADSELIEAENINATAVALVRYAAAYGDLSFRDVREAITRADLERRRQIVDQYRRFCESTNDRQAKSAYARELGVAPCTIAFWGQRFYGAKWLSKIKQPTRVDQVVQLCRDHPYGLTGSEVAQLSVISDEVASDAMRRALRRGLLRRDKARAGRWVYYAV